MKDGELDPLVKLGKRMREETKGTGLKLERFLIQPGLDGEQHRVQALFLVDDEPVEIEAPKPDPQFQQLIQNQQQVEQDQKEEKTRKAIEDMQKRLQDPNAGLGLDEEP